MRSVVYLILLSALATGVYSVRCWVGNGTEIKLQGQFDHCYTAIRKDLNIMWYEGRHGQKLIDDDGTCYEEDANVSSCYCLGSGCNSVRSVSEFTQILEKRYLAGHLLTSYGVI